MRLGFLASHGGTSARAIHRAYRLGRLEATTCVVICNNRDANVLAWAEHEEVPWRHLSGRTHPAPEDLDTAILAALVEQGVELVILSGYLKKLGPKTVSHFRNRILNIHPAPLPAFGGQGMYGLRVHEAVLAAGMPATEVSVHLVDEEYDRGPVVHRETLPIGPDADPDKLQKQVADVEPDVFLRALARIVSGEVDLDTLATSEQARKPPGERAGSDR